MESTHNRNDSNEMSSYSEKTRYEIIIEHFAKKIEKLKKDPKSFIKESEKATNKVHTMLYFKEDIENNKHFEWICPDT